MRKDNRIIYALGLFLLVGAAMIASNVYGGRTSSKFSTMTIPYKSDPGVAAALQMFGSANTAGYMDSLDAYIAGDTDTTYNAGNGVSLTGTTFSADNAVLYFDSEAAAHAGSASVHHSATVDTDTTYNAGTGIALAGTTFSYNGNFAGVGGSITDAQVPDTLTIDNNSTVDGRAISYYTSAWTSIANGATNTFAHGLGYAPDMVLLWVDVDATGWADSTTGTSTGGSSGIKLVDATNIVIVNAIGSTRYFKVTAW